MILVKRSLDHLMKKTNWSISHYQFIFRPIKVIIESIILPPTPPCPSPTPSHCQPLWGVSSLYDSLNSAASAADMLLSVSIKYPSADCTDCWVAPPGCLFSLCHPFPNLPFSNQTLQFISVMFYRASAMGWAPGWAGHQARLG